jgi:transposase
MSLDERMDERRNGQSTLSLPDPEVRPKAKHRRFTAEYKERILREAEACTHPGEIGALLRREGLYSSLLSKWRQQQAERGRTGLAPQKRGRKADPQAQEIARLRRENERLQAQLERAELIIEVQKKLSQLLGLPTEPTETDGPE